MTIRAGACALLAALALACPAAAQQAPQGRIPTSDANVDQLGDIMPGKAGVGLGGTVRPYRQIDKTTGAVKALPSFLSGVDGSGMNVIGTGQTTAAPLSVLYGDRPSVRFFGRANASGHWNGDGTNDDAPAINAAIAYYCSLPYGGNIELPNGTAAIASTVTQPCSNVHLVGKGSGAFYHDVGTGLTGWSTRLLWTGASGGTMVFVGPPTNVSTGRHNNNADVTGIFLDANNLAGIGLDWRSTSGSTVRVTYSEATQIGVRIDTVPLAEFNDPQHNHFWIEGSTVLSSGAGVRCDGLGSFPTSANAGNCSINTFDVYIQILNGDGLVFGFADHNTVDMLRVFRRPGGTGRMLVFGAGATLTFNSSPFTNAVAYKNKLHYVTGNAPIVGQGTSSATNASYGNMIDFLDEDNATPFPTVEAGSSVFWRNDKEDIGGGKFGVGTDSPAHEWDVVGGIGATFGYWLNGSQIIDGSNNAGFSTVSVANSFSPGQRTVAGLGSCGVPQKGQAFEVTDASGATWGSTITGGGSQLVLAICNGSIWVAH